MPTETIPLRDPVDRRAQLTAGAVRLAVVVIAALLAAVSDRPLATYAWLAPAAALGALAAAQRPARPLWRATVGLELVVATVAIPVTGGPRSPLLPYLLAPLFASGFRAGARYVVAGGVVAAVLLAAGLPFGRLVGDRGEYAVAATQWCVLGVVFGLVAAWARQLASPDDPAARYTQVSRLLGELRAMARRLPGSLDPLSAAEALLDECRAVTAYDRAAVLVPVAGERLSALVVRGADRLDLAAELTGDGPLARAWRSGAAVRETGRAEPGPAALLVVPVPSDSGCAALLALEAAAGDAFPPAVVQQVGRLAAAAAGRLESALLFDEIRRLATVEERQRLAREIHDGIAQELVYVGYELDGLGAELDAGKPAARESVRRTREHVTRIISELRLSIFTLRSTAEQGGLGAALGEYVRSVGKASGIAVHLTLSEDPSRLPADAESELLRIAQEAVNAARRQPSTRNLWVTLEVAPPRALLRVEHDGAAGTRDRNTFDIMRERAERLGARLRLADRAPAGSRVEVELGGAG